MSIPSAYLGVIIIWSTTPLAIKWSGEQAGFLFGVSARMAIGTVICLLILAVMRRPLPWHKAAWRAYASVAIGIFGAMSCVYWGAQFIPSGLVSVIFGLAPLITALMAALWLGEKTLTPAKWLGMALSLGGLTCIFAQQMQFSDQAWKGLLGVLLSVTLHSFSAILVKRSQTQLSVLQLTSGGLLVSLPLFMLSGWFGGADWPITLSLRSILSIVYLGLFGSVIGFMLYFYLLRHIAVSTVALATLITPMCALLMGQMLNGEHITLQMAVGSALVLCGLALHQWGAALEASCRTWMLQTKWRREKLG